MTAPSPSPSSEHLLALCKNGDREQLLSELQLPASAQVALSPEEVIVDPDVGTTQTQLNLQRMLAAASRAGHADTVEALLQFGQQHGVAGWHLATPDAVWPAMTHANALEVLLKFHDVEPTVFARPFPMGVTILGAACNGGPRSEPVPRKQFLGLVRHLMKLGFDPNTISNPTRDRPGVLLHTACWMACCEIVESLLEHGATIAGSRAARAAAKCGKVDVLETLLRYGADLDECSAKKDIDGPPGSALHSAVEYKQVGAVEWLLQHGADVSLCNSDGKTARDLVPADGDGDLKDILRRYGGPQS